LASFADLDPVGRVVVEEFERSVYDSNTDRKIDNQKSIIYKKTEKIEFRRVRSYNNYK